MSRTFTHQRPVKDHRLAPEGSAHYLRATARTRAKPEHSARYLRQQVSVREIEYEIRVVCIADNLPTSSKE